jgi:hypothetical protein
LSGVADRRASAYLADMSFWRLISPGRAVADLVNEWRQPNPYRWRVLGMSVAITFTLMVMLIPESQPVPPPRPEVTYITTFAPDRTDEEIVATNIENQRRKDELQALRDAAAERRRDAYRALGRATGIDVDAMEAQIARERAAEERAAEEAARQASETGGD